MSAWQSHFHPRWMAVTLAALVGVLTLTHIPQDAIPQALQKNTLDKVEHVAAYSLIVVSFLLSLRWPVRPVVLFCGLLVLLVIAALDEVTQPLVNRQASVGDYMADLIGMTIGGLLLVLRRPGRTRRMG